MQENLSYAGIKYQSTTTGIHIFKWLEKEIQIFNSV